jgi:hypothetical protein
MKEIPNKLQCAYCIRNRTHGGECTTQKPVCDEKGCLIFKPDERGCIRNTDLKIKIPLYHDFPLLNTWCDYWTIRGVDTEVKVNRIYGISWDNKKGNLVVHCNCDYFINEYHDDYKESDDKSILKIVK